MPQVTPLPAGRRCEENRAHSRRAPTAFQLLGNLLPVFNGPRSLYRHIARRTLVAMRGRC